MTVSLSNVTPGVTFTQAGSAVTLSPAVTVTDTSSTTLASATVAITGGGFTGDLLAATTSGTSITAHYNATTEILTLTGTDTLADYQQVLDSITFKNTSQNPTDYGSNPHRTVTWVLNDGGASNNLSTAVTETVSIIAVDQRPTLSNVTGSVEYTQGGTVILSSAASVSDPDSLDLASATVSITGGTFAGDGDVLGVNGLTSGIIIVEENGNTITYAYNSTTETLTLTGSDTLADYQMALEQVTFNSTSASPSNHGSNATRSVTWVLNDGQVSSSPRGETVKIDEPPTLSGVTTSASWTEEQASPTTLSPNVTISDPDGVNAQLSATVSIVGGRFAGDGDTLAISGATSGTIGAISFSYDSSIETLTLTGSDSLANYQTALDAVTFNAGENPTDFGSNPSRTLTWTVADHFGSESAPVTTAVNITNIDDPPTLSGVATSVQFTRIGQTVTVSPSVAVSDPDNLTLAGAMVQITGGTFAGDGDVLAATTAGTSIVANYDSTTETLTLSGSDSLANYQSVLDSVMFATGSNPTNAGSNPTRTLSWVVADGISASSAAITTITISAAAPRNDFNADGKSDLLWQNADGTPAVWELNGTSIIGGGEISNPGASWSIEASGDFNHDSKADVVLQNSDGAPQIWLMNGGNVASTVALPNPGPSWHVIASADFNNDGNADLLWQNTDGAAAIWELNGTSIVGGGVLSLNPGSAWHVIGAGDANGDGTADVLWQNADGTPAIWEMNGTSIIGGGVLANPGASWHAIGLGDFNGDGNADILWQNTDGAAAIWELNGTSIVGGGVLSPNLGSSWHAIGTSDFNGDGKADILWQNSDGTPAIWEMNGPNIIASGTLINPGSAWQLKDDGPISPGPAGPAGQPAPSQLAPAPSAFGSTGYGEPTWTRHLTGSS